MEIITLVGRFNEKKNRLNSTTWQRDGIWNESWEQWLYKHLGNVR